MDIEKLIEKANHLGMELKRDGGEFEYSIGKKFLEYATALSTLQAENEKLRAELEQVKAELDAGVEDVAAIIGDVEEIRRGYGVDNEDADGAFARLCETYCANNGCLCYAECEKYHCKNFKWRGI